MSFVLTSEEVRTLTGLFRRIPEDITDIFVLLLNPRLTGIRAFIYRLCLQSCLKISLFSLMKAH